MKPLVLACCLGLTVSACSTSGTGAKPLIPDKSLYLSSGVEVPLGQLATAAVIAGAVYWVYDPLAPNWEVKETVLGQGHYQLALKLKRHHTGGAGETLQLVRRRAEQLQRELGFAQYQLVQFTEGIESETLGARRVAHAELRLLSPLAADTFKLNDVP